MHKTRIGTTSAALVASLVLAGCVAGPNQQLGALGGAVGGAAIGHAIGRNTAATVGARPSAA